MTAYKVSREVKRLKPLLIIMVMEVLTTVIKQENETKGVKIREEEVKPSLFSGNVILYLENPQDVFSLQEVINKFDKVAGYKITIHESIAFLYTNNELSERKIKKIIPFTITSKRKKIPRSKSN